MKVVVLGNRLNVQSYKWQSCAFLNPSLNFLLKKNLKSLATVCMFQLSCNSLATVLQQFLYISMYFNILGLNLILLSDNNRSL